MVIPAAMTAGQIVGRGKWIIGCVLSGWVGNSALDRGLLTAILALPQIVGYEPFRAIIGWTFEPPDEDDHSGAQEPERSTNPHE